MKKSLPLATIILLFLFACASCGKKDSAAAKTDNLTGVTWTSTKIEYQQADGSWKDEQTVVNPADTHVYTFIFNADNTFSVKSVGSFSSATNTGTWHLINNNTQLSFTGNSYQGTYTITQLTSSKLQWTVVSPGFWGNGGRAVRETFGH
jgi:hypothetical protein